MDDFDHSTGLPRWGPQVPLAHWAGMLAAWDIWSVAAADRAAIAARAEWRFKDLVRHARRNSPYYRNLYRSLPEEIEPGRTPPVVRQALMAHFDEWVTDPAVTLRTASSFAADPERVGHPYLGRYAVWTSSGTTGIPGLFLHDERALAVYDALEMLRLGRGPLAPGFLSSLLLPGGRYAMVAAMGAHFAGVSSIERMRLLAPVLADRLRVFSILEPLPRLVEALNAYAPMLVATYPSVASLLAAERKAGRLAIRPSAIWLGGETLTAACREQVKDAFSCRVLQEYGASECMSIACECHRGRLHLNSDWLMLEPVDSDFRPAPPGQPSYTALLTNLANRVQPIIRYDIGDSVLVEPEPCDCGSPFPVLRVEGRTDDALCFRKENGEDAKVMSLALTTVVEDFVGAHGFQIVQTAPDALAVRLDVAEAGARKTVWSKVARALREHLRTLGLTGVRVELDPARPRRSARSGKLRSMVAYHSPQ